jgi:hypothetical protein
LILRVFIFGTRFVLKFIPEASSAFDFNIDLIILESFAKL